VYRNEPTFTPTTKIWRSLVFFVRRGGTNQITTIGSRNSFFEISFDGSAWERNFPYDVRTKDHCKIVFVRFCPHFDMMPNSTAHKIANPSCILQSTFCRTMLPSKKARTEVQASSIQPNVTLHIPKKMLLL
jgi:hypothetical protein